MNDVDLNVISDKLELTAQAMGLNIKVTGGTYVPDLRVLILDYERDVLPYGADPTGPLQAFGPLVIRAVTGSYVVFEEKK